MTLLFLYEEGKIEERKYIIFKLGKEEYKIDIMDVREITDDLRKWIFKLSIKIHMQSKKTEI